MHVAVNELCHLAWYAIWRCDTEMARRFTRGHPLGVEVIIRADRRQLDDGIARQHEIKDHPSFKALAGEVFEGKAPPKRIATSAPAFCFATGHIKLGERRAARPTQSAGHRMAGAETE